MSAVQLSTRAYVHFGGPTKRSASILSLDISPPPKRRRDDVEASRPSPPEPEDEVALPEVPAKTPRKTPAPSRARSRAASPQAGEAKKSKSKPREKKYQCTYDGCDKAFARPCRLDEHLRSHTGDRPFKCTADPENCDKAFLRDSHLKAHIRAKHDKIKQYRCTFMIPSGAEENRGVFGFKRKASVPAGEESAATTPGGERECRATFSTNQHLKRHLESHEKTYPYICKDHPPCTAGFRKKGQFTRHVRSEHLGLLPFACQSQDVDDPSKPCNASYDTKGKLRNHVVTHHSGLAKMRFFCHICQETPGAQVSGEQQEAGANQRLDTSPSEEDPASLLLNLAHRQEQKLDDSFPVIQTVIPKLDSAALHSAGVLGFATHRELRQHQKDAHPSVCKICNCTFKKERTLVAHVNEVHGAPLEQRKRFVCDHEGCDSRFTKKHALKKHIEATHLGLRPFVCPDASCAKTFAHKQPLQQHISRHHPDPANPPPAASPKQKKPRRKLTRPLTLVEELTGVGYEATGRHISCPVSECPHRTARWYDMKKHLCAKSAHAFEGNQADELILQGKMQANEVGTGAGEEDEEGESEEDDEEEYWSAGSESDMESVNGSESESESEDD